MTRRLLVGSAVLLLAAPSARAEAPRSLSFHEIVELAKARAPEVRLADTDIDIARGRLAGARVLATENPVLEGGIGSRWGQTRSTDREVSVSVPIELGGRRGKRIAAANAAIAVEEARARDVRRTVLGRAVAAYYGVLHADRFVVLARERRELAEKLVATARERKQAGDVAQLEVNLAEGELSRAVSGVAAAQRQLAAARTQLALVLGLPSLDGVTVTGKLEDLSFAERALADAGAARTDVEVARAALAAARADVGLADTARWPRLSVFASYAHEESADIVAGGVAIALPLFDRGQGQRAAARARRRRAAIALEATRQLARTEVQGARAAYAAAVEAVAEMKDRALPLAIENERMARESYAAGKLDLAGLLVVRREALETRGEYLDRAAQAALAAADLWVALGGQPTR